MSSFLRAIKADRGFIPGWYGSFCFARTVVKPNNIHLLHGFSMALVPQEEFM